MKGIKANSNEIRHKGKTLDKVLDKIKPDGSVIASKTQLGNVKIGDNINVDNDGTISVESLKTMVNFNTDDVPSSAASVVKIAKLTSPNFNKLYVPGVTTSNPGVVKAGKGLEVTNQGIIRIDPAHFITNIEFSVSVPSSQYDEGINTYFGNNPKEIVRCMGLNPDDFNNLDQFAEELINGEIGGAYMVTFYFYNTDDDESCKMLHGLFNYEIYRESGSIDSYDFYIGNSSIHSM